MIKHAEQYRSERHHDRYLVIASQGVHLDLSACGARNIVSEGLSALGSKVVTDVRAIEETVGREVDLLQPRQLRQLR